MKTLAVSNILYAHVDDEIVKNVFDVGSTHILKNGLTPLKREHLHITLVNQRFLKGKKKQLIEIIDSNHYDVPRIILDSVVLVTRENKKSIIVTLKNQDEFRSIVSTIMNDAKIDDYDKDRVFHISIANLDGSPYSSVGDVNLNDLRIV